MKILTLLAVIALIVVITLKVRSRLSEEEEELEAEEGMRRLSLKALESQWDDKAAPYKNSDEATEEEYDGSPIYWEEYT